MGDRLRVELFHASKFGNGEKVSEELKRVLEAEGHQVTVHHIDRVKPKEVQPADLYIIGSPTRFGGPIGSMRKFVKKASLPPGSRYAVFATHTDGAPDKKTGRLPTQEELDRERRTIPELDQLLKDKGLIKVTDKVFPVTGDVMKGTLREGWKINVDEFAYAILGAI
jgi:flavodoxin